MAVLEIADSAESKDRKKGLKLVRFEVLECVTRCLPMGSKRTEPLCNAEVLP